MTKRLYAQNTKVPAERSRAEIEGILKRYGATKFMSGYDETQAVIVFEAYERRVRFILPLPDFEDARFTPKGKKRTYIQTEAAHEQEIRRRWRSLAAAIKSKLDAVETGITTFEEEFMPHIVLPNGQTVAEYMLPQIDQTYETGQMPPMLPMLPGREPQ